MTMSNAEKWTMWICILAAVVFASVLALLIQIQHVGRLVEPLIIFVIFIIYYYKMNGNNLFRVVDVNIPTSLSLLKVENQMQLPNKTKASGVGAIAYESGEDQIKARFIAGWKSLSTATASGPQDSIQVSDGLNNFYHHPIFRITEEEDSTSNPITRLIIDAGTTPAPFEANARIRFLPHVHPVSGSTFPAKEGDMSYFEDPMLGVGKDLYFFNGTNWITLTGAGAPSTAAGIQHSVQLNAGGPLGSSPDFLFDTSGGTNIVTLNADSTLTGTTLFAGDINVTTSATIAQFDALNGIQMQTAAASGIDLLTPTGGTPIKLDAHGLLTLKSSNNDVRVRTVDGTIDAAATGSGDVRVRTVDGTIDAAATGSGALTLGTSGTGNLELKTNQGAITIGSPLSGILDLQTNTGNLQLRTTNAPIILQSGGATNGISLTTTSAGAPIELATQIGSKITLTTNLDDIDLLSGADVNIKATAADINLVPDNQVKVGNTGGTDGKLSLTDGAVDRIITSGSSARIEQTGHNGQPVLVNRIELAGQGDANGAVPSTSQSGTTIYTRGGVEILPNMYNSGILNAPMNGSTIRLGRYGWLPTTSIYQGAEVELSVASSPSTQGGSGNLYCNLVRENIYYYDASSSIGPTFQFGANGNGGVGQYYNGGNLQHILCQVGNQSGYFMQVTLPSISEALVGSTITVVRLYSNPTYYPGNNAAGIPRSEVAVVVVPSLPDLISGPRSIVAEYPGFTAKSLAADPFLQLQNDTAVISAPTTPIGTIKLVASRSGDGQAMNLPTNRYIWHYIGGFPAS